MFTFICEKNSAVQMCEKVDIVFGFIRVYHVNRYSLDDSVDPYLHAIRKTFNCRNLNVSGSAHESSAHGKGLHAQPGYSGRRKKHGCNGLTFRHNHSPFARKGKARYDLGLFFHVTSTHLMPSFQVFHNFHSSYTKKCRINP